MNTLTYATEEAGVRIDRIVNRSLSYSVDLERSGVEIPKAVQARGDSALLRYTSQFDVPGITLEELKVSDLEMKEADKEVDPEFSGLLHPAEKNIAAYDQAQKSYSWFMPCKDGSIPEQMFTPVSAAGFYIPGGRAGETPLISSLLMNSIPAIIAGVHRLQAVTPPRQDGSINPYLLMITQMPEIREVLEVGSAWAILEESYESLPAAAEPVEVAIQNFVENWRRAWEEGDLPSYIACYHPQFKTDEMDYQDLKTYKQDLFGRSAKRNIEIRDMQIQINGFSALVSFKQHYQAAKHRDVGHKTLHLRRHQDNWTILKENWQPLSAQG